MINNNDLLFLLQEKGYRATLPTGLWESGKRINVIFPSGVKMELFTGVHARGGDLGLWEMKIISNKSGVPDNQIGFLTIEDIMLKCKELNE